jgi:hypothetical protein
MITPTIAVGRLKSMRPRSLGFFCKVRFRGEKFGCTTVEYSSKRSKRDMIASHELKSELGNGKKTSVKTPGAQR